jgi:hypothetical protein
VDSLMNQEVEKLNEDNMRLLIQAGINVESLMNQEVEKQNEDNVRLLIQAGANVGALNQEAEKGNVGAV